MKHITVQVSDKKSGKEEILTRVMEAVEEMKLIKAGKQKARNAEDFLNEL